MASDDTAHQRLAIDPDIRRASTLPAEVYRDAGRYAQQVEQVMATSWHLLAANEPDKTEGPRATPLVLLPGCLDEPVVVTHDPSGVRHCLSNVCTHRGNIVVPRAGAATNLRCRYHGRRFGLDGRFAHMPEFDGAEGFPCERDDLPRVPHAAWGPLWFAGVRPEMTFDEWLGPLRERFAFVPWDRLELRGEPRVYDVRAHWALYCDNYLEGFHIPFVHAALAEALDYGEYVTETLPWGSLQIGIAKRDHDTLDLPAGHPDHGRRVAALYAWLYPGTMLNVYPWGISINAVQPLGPDHTRVVFTSLVHDASRLDQGAGGDLHRVELEDEAVVEAVQIGVRSRFYERGRFSPTREVGVHHFHRMLARALDGGS